MNLPELKVLIVQENVPAKVQQEVISIFKKGLQEENQVEVIVAKKYITVDVYDSNNMLIDKLIYKLK